MTVQERHHIENAQFPHGTCDRVWFGRRLTAYGRHPIPFWRAVHERGVRLGGDEGGCWYRVGEDLYVEAHTGTYYYHFVVPYHFAGYPVQPPYWGGPERPQ